LELQKQQLQRYGSGEDSAMCIRGPVDCSTKVHIFLAILIRIKYSKFVVELGLVLAIVIERETLGWREGTFC